MQSQNYRGGFKGNRGGGHGGFQRGGFGNEG
jgi:hypothetical protein